MSALTLRSNDESTLLVAFVRPASGRTRSVVVSRETTVDVPDGPTVVEFRLPSGEVQKHDIDVRPGEPAVVAFENPASEHEWLSLYRLTSRRSAPRPTKDGNPWALVGSTLFDFVRSLLPAQTLLSTDRGLPWKSAPPSWRSLVAAVDLLRVDRGATETVSLAGSEPPPELADRNEDAGTLGLTWRSENWDGRHDPRRYRVRAISAVLARPDGMAALEPMPALVTMLPLPWFSTNGTPHAVQYVLRAPGDDGRSPFSTEVVIHDPILGAVIAYLEAGDAAAVGALADEVEEQAAAMLRYKWTSPFGAAAGAYVLMRLGRPGRIDWTRNLLDGFPWLPDGGVIHATQLLRTYGQTPRARAAKVLTEARHALVEAANRGVPVFTEGVRLLADGLANVASTSAYRGDDDVAGALTYAESLALRARPDELCTTLLLDRPSFALLDGWRATAAGK